MALTVETINREGKGMKQWVSDLSTTNFRIFISIVLAVICTLSVLAAVIAGRELQTEALYVIFGFIALMLGLDVTQFVMKRRTELVTPPEVMAGNTQSRQVVAAETTQPEVAQILKATAKRIAPKQADD